MRSVTLAAFAAGGLLLLNTSTAQAWWWLHPHAHPHFQRHYAVPAAPTGPASPLHFQLPFGFGVNLSGVQVQGPLGNTVNLGNNQNNQRQQPPQPAQIKLDAATKTGLNEMKGSLNDLLKKTNSLSAKMYDPESFKFDSQGKFDYSKTSDLKTFSDIKGVDVKPKKKKAAGGAGGAGDKDGKGGKGGASGKDSGGASDAPK